MVPSEELPLEIEIRAGSYLGGQRGTSGPEESGSLCAPGTLPDEG